MRGSLPAWILAAAILVGTWLRMQDLLEPYEDGPRGARAALFALMAKNHLRYGATTTGGLGVLNPDRCSKEHFVYFVQHPQGTILLATLGAYMGGTQSGLRLIFLPFAIGIIFLTFRLARGLGRRTAVAAGAFTALAPLGVYYGAFVDFEIPTLFLVLLALHLYLRFHRRGRPKDRARAVLVAGAAVLCDWIALALPLALLATVPFLRRAPPQERRHPYRVAVLMLLSGGMAAGLVHLHARVQTARYGHAFEMAESYRMATPLGDDFQWSTFLSQLGGHVLGLLWMPLVLLALIGLVRALRPLLKRELTHAHGAAFTMFLIGLLNVLLHAVPVREYDLLYLLPAAAILGAYALHLAAPRRRPGLRRAHDFVLVVVLVALVFRSADLLASRRGFELTRTGEQIHEVTADGEVVILAQEAVTLQVTLASDRYVDFARDPVGLERARDRARRFGKQGDPVVVLVPNDPERPPDPRLLQMLEARGGTATPYYRRYELGPLR